VLPVWIAAGFLVYHSYQSRRALTERRMLETARALTMVVDRELSNIQASLSALATTPSLVSGDLPAFYRQALVVLEAHPGAYLILADGTGQLLINTFRPFGAPLPKRNVPDAVREIYATGKPLITNVFNGASSGRLQISVDVPVFRDGRVIYDLAMTVPVDRFATILLQQHLPPEWLGRIFDSNQIEVARTRFAEKFVGRHAVPLLGQRMSDSAEGTAEAINFESVPMFNSFSRSATSGWTVVIGVPKAIMMAEIWRWLWWTIAGTALLSLTGLALALLMARRIASSIHCLIAPALALGRGESVAVGHLELAEINDVGESLVKASQLIQQRAAERERAEAARREADDLKRFNAELERSESEARASATELAAILDAVPAVTFIAHDPACQRITSNRTGYDLLRLPPGANTSKSAPASERSSNYRLLRDGGELSSDELPLQSAAASGHEVRDCEYTVAFDDGSSRSIFGNAVPLRDDAGRVRGAVGAYIDITERKRAEKQLQATAERLKAILENAPVGIVITNREGRLIESNMAHQRMCGYSAEELKGKKFTDYTHPDDVAKNLQLFEQLGSDKLQSYEMAKRFIRKDGEIIWIRIITSKLNTENNIAIIEDITARKQAEEQLRATANRLQAILDNAPVGIVVGNRQYRFVESNAAFQRMVGYSADELKQVDWKALTHPDDIARNAALADGLMQGKLTNYELEKRYVLKDGKMIWIRSIGARLDEEHKISIIEDITERKEAAEQLRRSEARLRRLIDSNIVGVIIVGPDGAILDMNKAFLEMVGYAREDFKNGLGWRDLTPSELRAFDDAAAKQAGETGAFRPYEKELLRKNGVRFPVIVGGAMTEDREEIVFALDLTELKNAQLGLEQLARIVESADDAIISLSLTGAILSWNQGAERLLGYTKREMIGASEEILLPADNSQEWEQVKEVMAGGKALDYFKTVRIAKSGEEKPVWLRISPIRDGSGKIIGISKIARDRSEAIKAQKLEEQFRQAQKLESLGCLTGGVAHDFNNLLMVISSYTEMLQEQLPPEDPLRGNTQQVLTAAKKAANLIQQLLAFSRKQVLSPQVLDLNAVVDETAKMLNRLIGEDIELTFLPTKPLWSVTADPGQMTQVLMNLCVNARDAMPAGGKLTIETQNVVVDAQTAAKHPGFLPGNYAMLAVSDTGTGMTKEVQERLFEPFFTTKERGKGTGLGLATVYGIVKQSGGHIWVYSEPNNGSCFKLYFPRVDQSVTTTMPQQLSIIENHGETILVAEDEDSLRESISKYLNERGYIVLKAADGQQALELADRYNGPIHLLLTDVIMPKMSGPELARRLACRPGMVALFMSGYTDDAVINHGVLQAGTAFVQKPFSLSALGRKVRETLGSAKTGMNSKTPG
jgi:PAS domain S-box-containing protein